MNIASHVLECPPRDPDTPALKMTAKQYIPPSGDASGLTLLFAHCIGAHKEQWEPIIEFLFANKGQLRLREAWAFDWQNHGDAAVINRELLKDRPEGVSAFEWSAAISAFVQSPHMTGRRIVLVGHYAGAAAMTLTTHLIPSFALHYAAIILVEPTMVTREVFGSALEDRMSEMEFAVTATAARRDKWRSRAEARAYFSKRIPWGLWDPRVITILVEHGLELDQDSERCVRLKCDRAQESISYPDAEPHFEGAIQLRRICRSVPVHLVWGTRNDLVPVFIQESLSDPARGMIIASVTKVEDAGHMVVQEKPHSLAHAIIEILEGASVGARSKL